MAERKEHIVLLTCAVEVNEDGHRLFLIDSLS